MRRSLYLCVVTSLLCAGSLEARRVPAADNPVLRWNRALLESVAAERFAPMWTARALAIVHTCMYDAWAAYDEVAVGVHWGLPLRQPPVDRTTANKAEAISFAAYTALLDLFPARVNAFNEVLSSLGFPLPGSPGLFGTAACDAVLRFRRHDGSNQHGDLHPGAYADYTGYSPVNTPDLLADPNRWQPLLTPAGPQQFLAPHWGLVTPFVIADLVHLRPAPPPQFPHGLYRKEANHILHLSAQLDDTNKMIAEYWADGPATSRHPDTGRCSLTGFPAVIGTRLTRT